MTLELMKFHVQ